MKAHIRVDPESRLVHTVVGTAANVNDVKQAHVLPHGEERDVFGDVGYQGIEMCGETQDIAVNRHVATCSGERRALDKGTIEGGKLRD